MPLFFNHYYKKWFRIKGHSQLLEHCCVYLVKLSFVAKVALTLTCFFFRPSRASTSHLLFRQSEWQICSLFGSSCSFLFFFFFPPHQHFHVSQTTNHALYHMHVLIVLKRKCLAYQFSVQYFPYWRHCPRNNALDG